MRVRYSPEQLAAAAPYEIGEALERGRIIYFPTCPIELPAAADLALLREQLPRELASKNASYHPESGRVHGLKGDPALRELGVRVLRTHSERVEAFLHATIGYLTEGWRVGTSSFRPVQEKGRNLKPHASNELVHVDAGAYGATNGDRILRFFVNVNPAEDRVWATQGAFASLYQRYAAAAGVAGGHRLDKGPLDQLRTALLTGLAAAGVKAATVVDSSPYDRLMRRFHNYMKDTPAFQSARDSYEEMRFPPFSAWMVLTDTTSHASLSGQHALVNTFLLRLAACRLPAVAPYHILREGRAAA